MIRYRTMRADELPTALDWAAHEGWNPGLDDAAAFFAADPNGFFVADEDGAPVAAISVVNHSAHFAFLGLYLCLPSHRGRGIGYALWTHALAHAGQRTVGLDGVAAQEANYARSGFERTGATLRLEGEMDAQPDDRISQATPADHPALLRLDAAANGVARPAFMKAWLTETETRRTVVLRDQGNPTGFATLRRCRDGVKIGPVIAQNTDDALSLIRAGLAVLPATRVIIDVPSENQPLLNALSELGFAETFATARMYRGTPPARASNLQSIATMELG